MHSSGKTGLGRGYDLNKCSLDSFFLSFGITKEYNRIKCSLDSIFLSFGITESR